MTSFPIQLNRFFFSFHFWIARVWIYEPPQAVATLYFTNSTWKGAARRTDVYLPVGNLPLMNFYADIFTSASSELEPLAQRVLLSNANKSRGSHSKLWHDAFLNRYVSGDGFERDVGDSRDVEEKQPRFIFNRPLNFPPFLEVHVNCIIFYFLFFQM